MRGFYEFFSGGGMARAGLGPEWSCLFANDLDAKKSAAYRLNWGGDELKTGDVAALQLTELPEPRANLAWASFPCQDLSLAGTGAGLKGTRSGTFYPFWALMDGLIRQDRAPDLIVLENVNGALTSHGGEDFATVCDHLHRGGYRFGAVIIDAVHFVPQSRPRLFVIGVRKDLNIPSWTRQNLKDAPSIWRPSALQNAYAGLPSHIQDSWVQWRLPAPAARTTVLADLLEDDPDVTWRTAAETERLLALMNQTNLLKVDWAKQAGRRIAGCVYRRTRVDERGASAQRAEVRFDGLSGCLRTPAGGSSRQLILIVDGPNVKSRLISTRETARLMGLPDAYRLPPNYNEAYHLMGDGVVVPVVRHLAEHLLEPILAHQGATAEAAA